MDQLNTSVTAVYMISKGFALDLFYLGIGCIVKWADTY